MKAEKLTRDVLRAMDYDKPLTFELPSAAAALTARTLAWNSQAVDGCRYSTVISGPGRRVITITKLMPEEG